MRSRINNSEILMADSLMSLTKIESSILHKYFKRVNEIVRLYELCELINNIMQVRVKSVSPLSINLC